MLAYADSTQINWEKIFPVTFISMKQINLKQLWVSQKQLILQENSSISKYLTKKLGISIPTVLSRQQMAHVNHYFLLMDPKFMHHCQPICPIWGCSFFRSQKRPRAGGFPQPPTPSPSPILCRIIAWAITTDTYCETILLMFKGLVLKKGNKRALGACCTDSRKRCFAALFDLDFITCEDWEGNWLDFFSLLHKCFFFYQSGLLIPRNYRPLWRNHKAGENLRNEEKHDHD